MTIKPLKILIFSLSYLPNMVGGAEVAIKEISNRISSDDIEFSMITLRYDRNLPRYEKVGNIKVYRIGFTKNSPLPSDLIKMPMYLNKVFFPILAFVKAFWLDRKEKYDGFWSMMLFMSLPAMFFNLFFRKVPYIISIQEGDNTEDFMKRWFMRPFKFLVTKSLFQATSVQAISQYLSKWIRSMGYVGNLNVIPNGVDLERFKKNDNFSRSSLEAVLNIGDVKVDDFFIVSVSRLVYKNGLDVLINSLTFLDSNFKVVIVGDGPLKNDLKQKVLELNLNNRVFFVGDKSQEEVPTYLNLADAFCRPSRTEGQGIAFLEAMSCQLPVLATPVGGITEFLKEKITGLLFEVDNAKDLAQKISLLKSDKILRHEITQNAFRMVNEKYDWNKLTVAMREGFFNKIIKN